MAPTIRTIIFSLAVLSLASAYPATTPTPTPASAKPEGIDVTLVSIITKAITESTYLGENAFAIADNRPVETENITSSCFIEPRELHPSSPPPLQRLADDRDWLVLYQNYTKSVYTVDCPTFPPTDRTCITINNTLTNIANLKALLDKIIPAEKSKGTEAIGSGEESENSNSAPNPQCWNTSPAQQYWNFSTLGTLADLFIREDLRDLLETLAHK